LSIPYNFPLTKELESHHYVNTTINNIESEGRRVCFIQSNTQLNLRYLITNFNIEVPFISWRSTIGDRKLTKGAVGVNICRELLLALMSGKNNCS